MIADLSNEPIAQIEAITTQLESLRIGINVRKVEGEEDRTFIQKKALIIGNKVDLAQASQNDTALRNKYQERLPMIAISAQKGTGLEELKLKTYRMLDIIRVYTKTPGQKPDFNDPIILEQGSRLEDTAAAVHKDFRARLKYARLWGSGKHDSVMVKRDHILQDGDIIELHLA